MKRIIPILLCASMLLTLTACGGQSADSAETGKLVIWHDREEAAIGAVAGIVLKL